MNTLVEVVIADLHDKNTFHTYDQSTILQREKDWCLQRYIWQTELNLTKSPKVKIIETLTYSSNQMGI